MSEFFYRTEDIPTDDILQYFVETKRDREIVNLLKARNPVVLAGSRGVGKSFLLRVAESELLAAFGKDRTFPVYVTFSKSSLINTKDQLQFQHWMLARICARLVRALSKAGLLGAAPAGLSILTGQSNAETVTLDTPIEKIAADFEASWKQPLESVNVDALPSVEAFRDAIEDLCGSLNIERFIVLIDEAAHIFRPEQQRQFFTLFRDLRSPCISCKAAVYPGVTSYGDTFQPFHDATMIAFERDILSPDYVANMREIVEKQSDSDIIRDIARHGQNFAILAYGATGNPRVLLKTLSRAPKLSGQATNEVIREYYRSDVWSEHSTLPDKYAGHRILIDWGRKFIETNVLPDLKIKNDAYLQAEKASTCFFWIHRDAPQPVKEALKLLSYTGIVNEHAIGIKATRGEVGTRYGVNLGCLFALESAPTTSALPIAQNLTPKRMSEFGANHSAYQSLLTEMPAFKEPSAGDALQQQLAKSIDVLDIAYWLREGLRKLGLTTVGDVLNSSEVELMQIHYVGEKRSRRMRNAAMEAVYEYLSG
ncbi:MAG: hypothetical protein ABL995_17320 [Bryobacteraceae bacterium]